ncbi:MAG: HipA domain-containing protein [Ignavibacteria bacterium]|nr:HipA domain-containing protein [Ignavibacteria bacterium]
MSVKKQRKNILVYAHWMGLKEPLLTGILTADNIRGKEIFSFEYDKDWLSRGFAHMLDSDLLFFSGPQYPQTDKANFGLFLDSCPDRWGRMLMRRRESVLAAKEGRPEQKLYESDYLLGVYDGHRQGALRFKLEYDGKFLNDDKQMSAPPFTSLKDLEFASMRIEKSDAEKDSEYLNWINLLIAPGSSLGGARPKAGVVDGKNRLWIAKFPGSNDEFDKGAWEMIVNELSVKCGIRTAEGLLKKLSSQYRTYITKRFDRTGKGERIHYASAMTMLGYSDHADGAGYLDIAEFIIRNGRNPGADLEELWKRIVFNICVKNTDDHLRNHGFLLTPEGWELSPAFDVNPNPDGSALTLSISGNNNSLDTVLALEVADYFRVKNNKAKEIITRIKKSVNAWKSVASKYKISKSEQDFMASAFESK